MNLYRELILLWLLLLVACVSKEQIGALEPKYEGHYKIGTPYKINDNWYYPAKKESHTEIGHASWYGGNDGFHGKKTANGDLYDKNALTAAHRTLPLPSVVKVTNLNNKKSVILMVNDRGPFSKKRVIDVSERAAHLLNMKRKGSAKVKVELLEKETKELLAVLAMPAKEGGKAAGSRFHARNYIEEANSKISHFKEYLAKDTEEKQLFIQAGTYKRREKAVIEANKLTKFADISVQEITVNKKPAYRVTLGPIKNQQEAGKVLSKVVLLGLNDAIIVASK